jgi:hypothetical protein
MARSKKRNSEKATFTSAMSTLTRSLTGPRISTLREARRSFETAYVRYVIARKGGRTHAARALRIGLSTLKEKIR